MTSSHFFICKSKNVSEFGFEMLLRYSQADRVYPGGGLLDHLSSSLCCLPSSPSQCNVSLRDNFVCSLSCCWKTPLFTWIDTFSAQGVVDFGRNSWNVANKLRNPRE